MPELPEVETIKEQLKKELLKRKIIDVNILYNGIIEYPTIEDFKNDIINQTINNVERRGKWIVFVLDDYYLLSHLRMEGKYIFKENNTPINKHEHVIFKLDNGLELRYKDTRKFGKMHLVPIKDANEMKPLNELGIEPFDKNMTTEYLSNKFKNKSIAIKTALLDQTIIAGIGNIYADEILFLSNIIPFRRAKDITSIELSKIINNSVEVLSKSIEQGGTTVRTYTWKEGEKGHFQNNLYVYGRKGKPCLKCGNNISKTIVNGRGTHYCTVCQK